MCSHIQLELELRQEHIGIAGPCKHDILVMGMPVQ